MDSSISAKDEIWFLRVCHHISTGLYMSENNIKFLVLSIKMDRKNSTQSFHILLEILMSYIVIVGRDSSVGIASRYGLDGQRIESH